MQKITLLFLLIIPLTGLAQGDLLSEYDKAEILLQSNQIDSAYVKFNELEKSIPKEDTLYEYALWYNVMTATQLEAANRFEEKFEISLGLGQEALDAIRKGKEIFDEEFAAREYFMLKNIIVSNYGLGNFEEGNRLKEQMYQAQKEGLLPKGLDEYFNYDFFTFEDKNIWGYEWFAELPEDRFSSSFSKVVYYVYSTKTDGSDKDQLYRLHVLMFHGSGQPFDYVMTKRMETQTTGVRGTFYAYTYQEDIDFKKLKNDVQEILKGNYEPDTKSTTTVGKDGKVKVDVKLDGGKQ